MTIKRVIQYIHYNFLKFTDSLIQQQRKDPFSIPVIIINYNQLDHLKTLVSFLLARGMKNIVILDNNSDYQPLLNYYDSIEKDLAVERLQENLGHLVFFKRPDLFGRYGNGYYIITDPDILPNHNLPKDFLHRMINLLDKYSFKRNKVGFALDIDSLPNYYPQKENVIKWERQFWEDELEDDVFSALVDTTFALYKPQFPKPFGFHKHQFLRGIRIAGNFTAKHMGWYLDPQNLTDEQKHYIKSSSDSNSWKIDESGNLNAESEYHL